MVELEDTFPYIPDQFVQKWADEVLAYFCVEKDSQPFSNYDLFFGSNPSGTATRSASTYDLLYSDVLNSLHPPAIT